MFKVRAEWLQLGIEGAQHSEPLSPKANRTDFYSVLFSNREDTAQVTMAISQDEEDLRTLLSGSEVSQCCETCPYSLCAAIGVTETW